MLRFLRTQGWDTLIAGLILLEAAFMLYFHKGILPNAWNEIGFTLTSILIGVVLVIKYYGQDLLYWSGSAARGSRLSPAIVAVLLSAGLGVFAFTLTGIFRASPIDPATSDVIPTIELAVTRLLQGETVYANIDKWGYLLPLTYLPMQWLPYTLAEICQFDYRWIAAGIFFLASFVVVGRSNRLSMPHSIAVMLLVFYLLWMLVTHDTGILSMTVELMVAGYYMLLVCGISGCNPWLRGAVIALCLMSRYSLVLWLPLWALVEFTSGGRKDFFRSSAMIATLVLAFYIIPFLSHDWGAFGRGYHYYSQAAIGEWRNLDGQGVPYQLSHGMGFARRFYLGLEPMPVVDRLKALQVSHVLICVLSTLIMGLWYWVCRKKIHHRIFLLASFKIYLSLFLAFIQVPYPYLMITASAVSIAIFAELPRWRRRVVDSFTP